MAGLGFKDFQVGEVLTSSDVDGYLMQQAVMRFADSGARGSALGTAAGTGVALAEGMVSYLDDANSVQVYDGSSWRTVGPQVVSTAKEDTFSTTATAYTPVTGLSVSITPSSASSKILVIANVLASAFDNTNTTVRYAALTVYRDASAMLAPTSPGNRTDGIANFIDTLQNPNVLLPYVMVYVDSPATTSSTTYAVYGRKSGLSTLYVNRSSGDTDDNTRIRGVSTITAIEVAP